MEDILSTLYITNWKLEVSNLLKMKYPKATNEDIDSYLNKVIIDNINDRNVSVINNYHKKVLRTTITGLIDIIYKNSLVMAGGGVLFLPHSSPKENLLFKFIRMVQQERVVAKGNRKNYEKGSYEYFKYDIEQEGWKLIINALYGCLGYAGFTLHNLFIAESITNQGRHIITTSINAIEGFLGNAMFFLSDADLYQYINLIVDEVKVQKIDLKNVYNVIELQDMMYSRLIKLCKYDISDISKENIKRIISNLSENELMVLYYKNNLSEFNNREEVKKLVKELIETNGPLAFCERKSFNDTALDTLDKLWQLYEVYVFVPQNIFDRVRKAAYMDKTKCLYTDTDSVFISLDEVVKYVMDDIYSDTQYPMTDEELRFTSVNIYLYYLNIVIDKALKGLCRGCNIAQEHHHLISMKNEFFMDRIIFINKKKRYIALMRLQEGILLNNGKGSIEVKGFDFKKAVTKQFIREYYEELIEEEILYCDEIKPRNIFSKLLQFKNDIDEGLRQGDRKYFKQANVKIIDAYKIPYSQQGVTSIILWNCICPDHRMDLPTDINVVPIKAMGLKKVKDKLVNPTDNPNIAMVKETYPDVYERLLEDIYGNTNPLISGMSLTSIALPKNTNVPIHPCIIDLIDYNKITTDALKLILPITKVIGLKSLPVSTTVEHLSNIIEL